MPIEVPVAAPVIAAGNAGRAITFRPDGGGSSPLTPDAPFRAGDTLQFLTFGLGAVQSDGQPDFLTSPGAEYETRAQPVVKIGGSPATVIKAVLSWEEQASDLPHSATPNASFDLAAT